MNIIKGIDRIALVLAIIAGVLGFFVGGGLISEELRTETPEYKEWKQREQQKIDSAPIIGGERIIGLLNLEDEPFFKYQAAPLWKSILGGVICIPISFIVVLFGVRGATRGIKKFSLWIIAGFKD